jgi:hypothetical protein
MDDTVADDILDTRGIARERYGDDNPKTCRKVRRDFAKGLLGGCWREGGVIRGSRAGLRAAHRHRAGLDYVIVGPAAPIQDDAS